MIKENKLTKKNVEHVAKLARIEISEKEKEMYSKQLSSILNYVEKLNEVDTKGIEPTLHAAGLSNVVKRDVQIECKNQDELVAASPVNERKMVKVKAVLKGGKQ